MQVKISRWLSLAALALATLALAACGGSSTPAPAATTAPQQPAATNTPAAPASAPTLKISGIPDQDTARLARRFQVFADYMQAELGVPVQFVPSADYAAVVTAFTNNDLQLAFFGGLTGVQARLQNPGAQAIAQRDIDAQFHSVFLVRSGVEVASLEDLKAKAKDLTITFGSESSTSGHLMPRFFLTEADIDPDKAFKSAPSYSGSHDKTWQLVEANSYDVGALSAEVWNRAVSDGKPDASKLKVFYTTPAYVDYNWSIRGDADQTYGAGFTQKVKAALLKLNKQANPEIMELFAAEKFIDTNNENYKPIENVARGLGIVQ